MSTQPQALQNQNQYNQMFDPKESQEIISLINDFDNSAGVKEWFIPTLRKKLEVIEAEILDEGTSAEITTRLKMTRAIWLEVLELSKHQKISHQANIESFVAKGNIKPRETT